MKSVCTTLLSKTTLSCIAHYHAQLQFYSYYFYSCTDKLISDSTNRNTNSYPTQNTIHIIC